jgi:hypothetical protein
MQTPHHDKRSATPRPVSLDRIIAAARFLEMTRACSRDELAGFMRISGRRAEEIADEAGRIGLVEKEGSMYCATPGCSAFMQCVRAKGHRPR